MAEEITESIESRLLKIIEDQRAEIAALHEIILKKQGLLDDKVIIPEAPGRHVGKEPWYITKTKAEAKFRLLKEPAREDIGGSEGEENAG